jgi:hypothetical protein
LHLVTWSVIYSALLPQQQLLLRPRFPFPAPSVGHPGCESCASWLTDWRDALPGTGVGIIGAGCLPSTTARHAHASSPVGARQGGVGWGERRVGEPKGSDVPLCACPRRATRRAPPRRRGIWPCHLPSILVSPRPSPLNQACWQKSPTSSAMGSLLTREQVPGNGDAHDG